MTQLGASISPFKVSGNTAASLVRADSVSKRFGGVQALRDVSFDLREGEILGLIGPNGSGKSTCVNVLSGTLQPTSGKVLLRGQDIATMKLDAIVAGGMIRTYQATQIFPEFTVLENVLIGSHSRFRSSPFGAVFRSSTAKRESERIRVGALEALEAVGLGRSADVAASTLSAANQRLLMIAITIAASPKVVLLDEPAAGMVSNERKALADVIASLPSRGISVLVIEHHMALIMEICHRIVVLNFGQKIADGTPEEIRADEAVIEAYLGRRDANRH